MGNKMKSAIVLSSALIGFIFLLSFVFAAPHTFTIEEVPDSAASCSDSIQNGNETGIDCGGGCSACEQKPPATNPPTGSNDPKNGPGANITQLSNPKTSGAAEITTYPREIKISKNASLDFTITAKNTGNAEIQGLTLEPNSEWIERDKAQFSLSINETRNIPLKIRIPENTVSGAYSLNISLRGASGNIFDAVSFAVLVLDKPGTASIATVDTSVIKDELERLKSRITLFSSRGYDTKASEDLLSKARELFENGSVLESSDYLALANNALDKSMQKKQETQTFLVSYALAGIIVCLIVLTYYFYKKYRDEERNRGKPQEPELNEPNEYNALKRAAIRDEAEAAVDGWQGEKAMKPQGKTRNSQLNGDNAKNANAPEEAENIPASYTGNTAPDDDIGDMEKKLEEIRKRLKK